MLDNNSKPLHKRIHGNIQHKTYIMREEIQLPVTDNKDLRSFINL